MSQSAKKELQAQADKLMEAIADGQAANYAEYMRKVGQRRGLLEALRIIKETPQGQDVLSTDDD